MLDLFDLDYIFIEIFDYPLSYIELFGTLMGVACVYYASKNNVLTWPTGLLNVTASFIIFYQVYLYSDMFLQLFFFATNVYGWLYWNKQSDTTSNLTVLSNNQRVVTIFTIAFLTVLIGYLSSNLHVWASEFFKHPAAFPYIDAFTTGMSLVATVFMARRIVESWVLWILIDIVSCVLYYQKGILFISLEFVVFLFLAIYGCWNWIRLYRNDQLNPV
ncbi:nicotinamide riboside transporter PnuC [Flammeovirga agarivorans]|uniref:Nicotinamide riboside transporter PnuC n=1 Tax=Flammeovirga agarivorans TaxID=2726742 RepID=A0A7X8SMZ3_9BACT|nr:nicotinamide riboside transporter PnuC [Flammeovirga agarivorans]NLR93189.1 nicotinamide mononucleotide transporter [Flammeovirga agarivorans]